MRLLYRTKPGAAVCLAGVWFTPNYYSFIFSMAYEIPAVSSIYNESYYVECQVLWICEDTQTCLVSRVIIHTGPFTL